MNEVNLEDLKPIRKKWHNITPISASNGQQRKKALPSKWDAYSRDPNNRPWTIIYFQGIGHLDDGYSVVFTMVERGIGRSRRSSLSVYIFRNIFWWDS